MEIYQKCNPNLVDSQSSRVFIKRVNEMIQAMNSRFKNEFTTISSINYKRAKIYNRIYMCTKFKSYYSLLINIDFI